MSVEYNKVRIGGVDITAEHIGLPVYVTGSGDATLDRDPIVPPMGSTIAGMSPPIAGRARSKKISFAALPSPPIPTGPACLMTATGARGCADGEGPLTDRPEDVRCPGCAPVAQRLIRERDRRAIDALLREDARRFPAFARARFAAVMAQMETIPNDVLDDCSPARAANILDLCHALERRPGRHLPASVAERSPLAWFVVYERERGRCASA